MLPLGLGTYCAVYLSWGQSACLGAFQRGLTHLQAHFHAHACRNSLPKLSEPGRTPCSDDAIARVSDIMSSPRDPNACGSPCLNSLGTYPPHHPLPHPEVRLLRAQPAPARNAAYLGRPRRQVAAGTGRRVQMVSGQGVMVLQGSNCDMYQHRRRARGGQRGWGLGF